MIVPPGDPAAPELGAEAIRSDVDAIVSFAQESRTTKEIRTGQLWGPIAGFPSGARTVQWAVEQLRKARIPRIES